MGCRFISKGGGARDVYGPLLIICEVVVWIVQNNIYSGLWKVSWCLLWQQINFPAKLFISSKIFISDEYTNAIPSFHSTDVYLVLTFYRSTGLKYGDQRVKHDPCCRGLQSWCSSILTQGQRVQAYYCFCKVKNKIFGRRWSCYSSCLDNRMFWPVVKTGYGCLMFWVLRKLTNLFFVSG